MEDGLGQEFSLGKERNSIVLILVLMEDGLGHHAGILVPVR